MEGLLLPRNHSHVQELALLAVPTFPVWQLSVIVTALTILYVAHLHHVTIQLRSILQPTVMHYVGTGVSTILKIQAIQNPVLDYMLASMSILVSVEFYTAFLPLLFWSGHCKLGRQMSLLMALCLFVGNSVKDLVSAPRPLSPPVRKLLTNDHEKENALEYGLPSSHTINTLCCSGYLLYYLANTDGEVDWLQFWVISACLTATLVSIIYGRLYLGMHSPIDIVAGVSIGCCILLFWCTIDEYIDNFISGGENVIPFCVVLGLVLQLAYPTPEKRNPSYEYHTAFNGVAMGMITGINRSFSQFHHSAIPIISWSSSISSLTLVQRLLVGFPVILGVKLLIKIVAIKLLPSFCSWLGLQVQSTCYVPDLNKHTGALYFKQVAMDTPKRPGHLWKFLQALDDDVPDVDAGIRILQYGALGWSAVELVPIIFTYLNL